MHGDACTFNMMRTRQTPRGLFVLIVGPDGSGKSTLARRLVEEPSGRFDNTVHMHWRPGLLPRPGDVVGTNREDASRPHAREPHGALISLALLTYDWLDFLLGSWMRIVPRRSRGALIVMERGWLDIAVDPRRYRLSVSGQLVEWLGRLLPSPDLVMILRAHPDVLSARKGELPEDESLRQTRRWDELRFSRRTRRLLLDASESPDRLLEQARDALRRYRKG
jgi:thymidylate kinase